MHPRRLISGFLFILGFATAITVKAEEDPSQYLRTVADRMIAKVEKDKAALKQDVHLAEQLVRHDLLPIIDQEGFAKRTLGKKIWTEASAQERTEFVDAFTSLVINTYAKGLSLYDGQKFSFDAAVFSSSGKSAIVKSAMQQADGAPVAIDYRLISDGSKWLIVDLTIEGVSMVKSYKNQFVPRVQELGMAKFLAELKQSDQKS